MPHDEFVSVTSVQFGGEPIDNTFKAYVYTNRGLAFEGRVQNSRELLLALDNIVYLMHSRTTPQLFAKQIAVLEAAKVGGRK